MAIPDNRKSGTHLAIITLIPQSETSEWADEGLHVEIQAHKEEDVCSRNRSRYRVPQRYSQARIRRHGTARRERHLQLLHLDRVGQVEAAAAFDLI